MLSGESIAPDQAASAHLPFVFDSPEVNRASHLIHRVATSEMVGVDAWRFPNCHGVVVFYQPVREVHDVAWYWFDVQRDDFTRVVRLRDLLDVLAPHLENLTYPRHGDISILHTPTEPRYEVARSGDRLQYLVEVAFSVDRCEPAPSQVRLVSPDGEKIPVAVDLVTETGRIISGR